MRCRTDSEPESTERREPEPKPEYESAARTTDNRLSFLRGEVGHEMTVHKCKIPFALAVYPSFCIGFCFVSWIAPRSNDLIAERSATM